MTTPRINIGQPKVQVQQPPGSGSLRDDTLDTEDQQRRQAQVYRRVAIESQEEEEERQDDHRPEQDDSNRDAFGYDDTEEIGEYQESLDGQPTSTPSAQPDTSLVEGNPDVTMKNVASEESLGDFSDPTQIADDTVDTEDQLRRQQQVYDRASQQRQERTVQPDPVAPPQADTGSVSQETPETPDHPDNTFVSSPDINLVEGKEVTEDLKGSTDIKDIAGDDGGLEPFRGPGETEYFEVDPDSDVPQLVSATLGPGTTSGDPTDEDRAKFKNDVHAFNYNVAKNKESWDKWEEKWAPFIEGEGEDAVFTGSDRDFRFLMAEFNALKAVTEELGLEQDRLGVLQGAMYDAPPPARETGDIEQPDNPFGRDDTTEIAEYQQEIREANYRNYPAAARRYLESYGVEVPAGATRETLTTLVNETAGKAEQELLTSVGMNYGGDETLEDIEIAKSIAADRRTRAIEANRSALAEYGILLPANPTQKDIDAAWGRLNERLAAGPGGANIEQAESTQGYSSYLVGAGIDESDYDTPEEAVAAATRIYQGRLRHQVQMLADAEEEAEWKSGNLSRFLVSPGSINSRNHPLHRRADISGLVATPQPAGTSDAEGQQETVFRVADRVSLLPGGAPFGLTVGDVLRWGRGAVDREATRERKTEFRGKTGDFNPIIEGTLAGAENPNPIIQQTLDPTAHVVSGRDLSRDELALMALGMIPFTTQAIEWHRSSPSRRLETAAWDVFSLATPLVGKLARPIIGATQGAVRGILPRVLGGTWTRGTMPWQHVPRIVTGPFNLEALEASARAFDDIAATGRTNQVIGGRHFNVPQTRMDAAYRQVNPNAYLVTHTSPDVQKLIQSGVIQPGKEGYGLFTSPGAGGVGHFMDVSALGMRHICSSPTQDQVKPSASVPVRLPVPDLQGRPLTAVSGPYLGLPGLSLPTRLRGVHGHGYG